MGRGGRGEGRRNASRHCVRRVHTYSIRTIPPKLCVDTRERGGGLFIVHANLTEPRALFTSGRNISRGAASIAVVLARPAPLRLGLLIVLELLVRRIIELQLLPRMMKVDATAATLVREREPRRLMKTNPLPPPSPPSPLQETPRNGSFRGTIRFPFASSRSLISPPLRFLGRLL